MMTRAFAYGLGALLLAVFAGPSAYGRETNLYWGDTHLHTSYSFDAYGLGNRSADPDTAYRFAKGLPVVHPGHRARVRIDQPLDFLVITDHAEMLGVIPEVAAGNPRLLGTEVGRMYHEMLTTPGRENEFFNDFAQRGTTDPASIAFLSDREVVTTAWSRVVEAAERHNDPGTFTAFIGWEWSSTPDGNNLHRIVFTPDGKDKALQYLPFSLFDSEKPADLWQFLQRTAEEVGTDFVAIGHNSNLSNGRFFPLLDESDSPVDAAYARLRRQWEPLVEVTQYKGDSETHPVLSPADEFADFERFRRGLDGRPVTPEVGSYARAALLRGMQLEGEIGVNPYKFGMIGATDSHTGLSSAEEDNFLGKYVMDSIPESKGKETVRNSVGWDASAMGFTGVWAAENSRRAITAAFKRKEVYATTGPRIRLRVFGGWDFEPPDSMARDLVERGYARGVAMGGDLTDAPPGKVPSILISAEKGPFNANLDRIQVVKGWIEAGDAVRERVYDVAWSGDRQPGANGRLAPVGNTVSIETGRYENSIGAARLATVWKDPDFDPGLRAFYYVRVLQVPTPRHSLFDTIALQQPPEAAGGHPSTIQERAYSSPIWYTP